MAARAMGSATISFGLVNVPVKLYSTSESSRNISFNWIHEECGTRVQQRFWCPKDERIVERDELVKGYQFARDQYVLFTPDELKKLDAQATEAVEIVEFVPLEQVERLYLDRAYYLGPDKGGERAYRLLSAALGETGRAALGSYAARGKQYVVLVRPHEEGLLMEQLRYADEVKPFEEVPIGDGKVKKEEMKLAVQLIEQGSTDEYHPEQFEDEVYKRVLEQIERKIQGEEITDRFESRPVHVNATNIAEFIPPQGGSSVADVLQRNIDAVLEQRRETDRPMFPHVNHPNFGWAVTAEDLMDLEGEKFFEVYNGHPLVHNRGDSLRPSTERIWDIVLTHRLTNGLDVMYGIATDDAHNYGTMDSAHANPARGWVMVRAQALTPEAIIAAMEAGDFYASTGVVLRDVVASESGLSVSIEGEPGVTYVTEFIGTRVGFDTAVQDAPDVDGLSVTRRYSPDIGTVLAEVTGLEPTYSFIGDEIYVRARVRSSRPVENPVHAGEAETAWGQPVVVR